MSSNTDPMNTEWFDHTPGQPYIKPTDPSNPDGEQIIVITPHPDWVRFPSIPDNPLTDRKLRVVRRFTAACPQCRRQLDDNASPLLPHCAECTHCKQFSLYWGAYDKVSTR